jgi:hypothetical protein
MASDLIKKDCRPFNPTPEQALAKARFHARLAERSSLIDAESLDPDDMVEAAGAPKLYKWRELPGFWDWFLDQDTFHHRAVALKDRAMAELEDIIGSEYIEKILTAKDKLKAIDMLLNLTGAYPAKQREVKFLDKDLEAMTPEEVELQKAELQQKLTAGSQQQ